MTVDYALSRSSFAARIAELRERAGYSQAEVVRRSGGHVSQANLSQWELGAATPNVVCLPSLAAALGVGVWELFEEPSADFKRSPSKYSPTKNARG